MNVLAVFGAGILMSAISSVVIARLYAWPWLLSKEREQALATLVTPHMFLRFIGLSFLVPGVVSGPLPAGFAVPAAYGDFTAGVLAIIAMTALSARASWAIAAVWVFNVWGAADLLLALFDGPRFGLHPGNLGAAYFIPTVIVPPLLVTHLLIFGLLARGARKSHPAGAR